jgi:hypothetical protein
MHKLAPPASSFAASSIALATPHSFGIVVPGNPPPLSATDFVRRHYEFLLAGILHG